MNDTTSLAAVESQIVTLTPATANALAAVLKAFSDSVDAPELECDPRAVLEIDIQRAITFASLATCAPSASCHGNS